MRDFLRRIRLPLLFAALLLATLGLMLGDRRAQREFGERAWPASTLLEIAVPIQRVISWPAERLADAWAQYVDLVKVRAENQRLSAQVADLQEEVLQYQEALVASGNLKRIVEMRKDFEVPLLPARVVGSDVSPFFHALLLNRGHGDAVLSGMPVVADRGLVGLVTATSRHAARTMLLMDRRSAVDAIVQRSRARGIVHGTGSGELRFVLLVRGDDVQPGDVVITSGVGGVYPQGLRIGTVETVHENTADLLHWAQVKPSVDFGRLEQVFVMEHREPTMDLLYEGEGDLDDGPPGRPEKARR
jgi:rod shape-determining protein MreC